MNLYMYIYLNITNYTKFISSCTFSDIKILKNARSKRDYRSFIGVNMTCKNHIYFVLNKPWLIYYSHGFAFHVMIAVAVVPWAMHKNN